MFKGFSRIINKVCVEKADFIDKNGRTQLLQISAFVSHPALGHVGKGPTSLLATKHF